MEDEDEDRIYEVILNAEEQFSIWPQDRQTPDGWRLYGFSGTKTECLEKIEEVWTDMRPLSLRKKMEEDGR